jgi:putative membrane protein
MFWDWWPGPCMGFPLFPIIFMVVFFLIMMFVMMPMMRRWHSGGSERTPLDVLNERFARGGIDRTEYDERRRIIAGR